MLNSLNTALVSLGYEPVDAITGENHKLWYELALIKGVPAKVLDVIFEENQITSSCALLKLTKDLSIDQNSFIHYDNDNSTQNDNQAFLRKFLSYHQEKSQSLGATSVSINSGIVHYAFGKVPVGVTKMPIGISGEFSHIAENKVLSSETKVNLFNLSKVIIANSRPLILMLGHHKEVRAEYLSSILRSQGEVVRTVEYSDVEGDLLTNPCGGYTIALANQNGIADFLTLNIKGDKLKADRFAQIWSASSSEVIFPELCKCCSIDKEYPATTYPEKGFSTKGGNGKVVNVAGCRECFKGYSGTFSVFESFSTEDSKMVEVISIVGVQEPAKSEYTKVQSSMSSKALQDLYNLVEKAITNGQVSFNDAKRTLL